MKAQTVNVIEYSNDVIKNVNSFSDDNEGNAEAEEHFKTIIQECDSEVTDEEMEVFVEDGFHEQGDWQLFLVHAV